MAYKVGELAALAGVSTRTLRYYDRIGLLKPAVIRENGYRVYGAAEVDRLQQILFYRELGFELGTIGQILDAPGFDHAQALAGHLSALEQRKAQLETLIQTVKRTLEKEKGEKDMTDKEKFEGFKREQIEKNEQAYGQEVRARYGDAAMDESNARAAGMTQSQWEEAERLRAEIDAALESAMDAGDPCGAEAARLCDLHRQWLTLYWGEKRYSKGAHLAMGQMYAADERFTAYYDRVRGGATAFLLRALEQYCQQ